MKKLLLAMMLTLPAAAFPVWAQNDRATQNVPADSAEQDTYKKLQQGGMKVHPEIATLMQSAMASLKEKRPTDALDSLNKAADIGNQSLIDTYIIEYLRFILYASHTHDLESATKSINKIISMNEVTSWDKSENIRLLVQGFYKKYMFKEVVFWSQKYFSVGGQNQQVRAILEKATELLGGSERNLLYSDANLKQKKGVKVPVPNTNCFVYYPFAPVPPNLTVEVEQLTSRGDQGRCDSPSNAPAWPQGPNISQRGAVGEMHAIGRLIFYSNGEEHARTLPVVSIYYGHIENKICDPIHWKQGVNCASEAEWKFSDGEVWTTSGGNWRKSQSTYAVQNAESKRRDQMQKEADRKAAEFRRNLEPGQMSSSGMIIEVKGKLAKIQKEESQCSQRDYNSNCMNWITTRTEVWMRISDLNPG